MWTYNLGLYDRARVPRSLFDTITYRVLSQVATILGYIALVGTLASLRLEQTLWRF
jgi:hypothetical protein